MKYSVLREMLPYFRKQTFGYTPQRTAPSVAVRDITPLIFNALTAESIYWIGEPNGARSIKSNRVSRLVKLDRNLLASFIETSVDESRRL